MLNQTTKFLILATLILTFLARSSFADFWRDPTAFDTYSDNKKYIAHVTPAEENKKSRLDVFATNGVTSRALWKTTLSNEVRPIYVHITDDGEHVVTVDNYFKIGYGDDVVAFYNRHGQIIKYSLEQILPEISEPLTHKARELIEDKIPGVGYYLPHSTYESFISGEKFDYTSYRREWMENSIAFLFNDPKAPAFCIWLGWDQRWLAWDVITGKALSISQSSRKRWEARGREIALQYLKDNPFPSGGEVLFVGMLKNPEDRKIIERYLHDTHFGGGSHETSNSSLTTSTQSDIEFFAYSTLRKMADRILAVWDGHAKGLSKTDLENHEGDYFSLGTIKISVTFPEPPKKGFTYIYLMPISISRDAWQTAAPEWCEVNYLGERKLPKVLTTTLYGVNPGEYWIKVIWGSSDEMRKNAPGMKVIKIQSDDYISTQSPVVKVEAGKVLEHININCTEHVK